MSKRLEIKRIINQNNVSVLFDKINVRSRREIPDPVQIWEEILQHPLADPKKIFVWINTFNRTKELSLLLSDIYKNQDNYQIKIFVLDDCSNESYIPTLRKFSSKLDITYQRVNYNHGKKNYWKLCNYALQYIKSEENNYRYFIKLDDDCRLVPDFFKKNINIWETINDNKKVSLNFLLDSREGQSVWTKISPKLLNFGSISVYQTQWVDMNFFCENRMFKALGYKISKQTERRWLYSPEMSSGVGKDISVRLSGIGLNLYLTTQTLVIHTDHTSRMNPEERFKTPLTTKPITQPDYGL